MSAGYYRFPTIHGETVVFVSEDDLWSVPAGGGVARRLTSNLGEVSYPMLSPDGAQLAFVGSEEGAGEVYVMDAAGGPARRLTYLSSNCRVLGWTPDGASILFTSNHAQPDLREMALFRVLAESSNGEVTALPYGPARSLAYGPGGALVLGRNTGDPARWKRYRGGTAGHLWIDRNGDGEFQRFLADLAGNIASPMWLVKPDDATGRIYFVSDHEGVGNLYSCTPAGDDVQRHTDHEAYYVRNPSSDGKRIVYHVGADLYLYDPATETEQRIDVVYGSPRVQRNRKFVDAARYLDGYQLHPQGKTLAITTRGKAYTFFNHEGPVLQYGKRDGVRYRKPTWLEDGRRLLLISDEPGEETIEIYDGHPTRPPKRLEGLDIGRVLACKASPVAPLVALSNHRHELLLVDVERGTLSVVDRSDYHWIEGFDWSPDGRWLAYAFAATSRTMEIRLYQLPEQDQWLEQASDSSDAAPHARGPQAAGPSGPLPITGLGVRHVLTRPVLRDVQPSFDPDGKYLYFLSYREFNPVYDGLHFDLGFPWGMRPYLITLQKDLPNPFIPVPDFEDEENEDEDGDAGEEGEGATPHGEDDEGDADGGDEDSDDGADDDDNDDAGDDDDDDDEEVGALSALSLDAPTESQTNAARTRGEKSDGKPVKRADTKAGKKADADEVKPIRIDLEGIQQRLLPFPVLDGRYGQIMGVRNKALFTVFPIQGQLDGDVERDEDQEESGSLRVYDFKEYKAETLAEHVSAFDLSANGKKLVYWSRGQLRVINAGEKAPPGSGHTRKSGWIDLGRVKVSVDPQSEWEQMFREAWRLQRDHFWTEDMSEVDWRTVYARYFPLIRRVSTRGEFSDLMWEMQGELGTSHAYEFGGDYRAQPHYGQGFLGAEVRWDAAAGGYRIEQLVLGDPWDSRTNSPLAAPGVDVRPGDVIIAVNGQPLDEHTGPAQLLVNQAGQEVLLTLAPRPDRDAASVGAESASASATQKSAAPEAAPPADSKELDPLYGWFTVKTIRSEAPARYRRWVEDNRSKVHAATDGRVGYLHIPDMGAPGYAEFHRGYLAEVDRDALIVDVRYNSGGHVSALLLEKLARRRLGYDKSRWGGLIPYPNDSVAGPLVALTNEHAGSDGDIFCHSFKMMKLGPLIGKRTWGGVIGIWPRYPLVDGTVTTQPEFSFWFEDVGWGIENYGTDPDIEVDFTPQDYRAGRDPQLARAIEEALRLLAERPVAKPELTQRPSRALPKLPPRNGNGST